MIDILDTRLNTLADRLEVVISELRTLAAREDLSDNLSRATAVVSSVVEDLEMEWVAARAAERPFSAP